MPRRPGLFRVLTGKFVAGLIILVPIVITVQALWLVFVFLDEFARPVATAMLRRVAGIALPQESLHELPGLGFLTMVLVVLATGLLFSGGPLRRLLDRTEGVIEYIPVVGALYGTIKKVFEGFGTLRSSEAFKRFVLARMPGKTAPGFLTGSFTLQRSDGTRQLLCTVYIPTNHLYVGDIVVVPAEDVIETDLSVEDGISLILSAGVAVPTAIGESRADPAKPAIR